MHESRLVREILTEVESAVARSGGTSASALRIAIGPFAGIEPESFRRHFEVAAAGGIAAGADLHLDIDDAAEGPSAVGIMLRSVVVEG